MKTLGFILANCLLACATIAQELSWQELASRPEIWPAQCALKRPMRFQSGASVAAGQKMDVVEIQPNRIGLASPDGRLSFAAKPEDTDALVVARELWGKLTPAQRALTYSALLSRTDLWPYRVAGREQFDMGGGKTIRKGEKLILLGVEGGSLLVLSEKYNTSFTVTPRQTELLDHARKVVADKERPGRLLEELQGKLIDPATGQPAALETKTPLRYLVFYHGAGWCPPCRQFSPSLLQAYNKLKPEHPDFDLIFLSDDHSLADLQKYAKEEGFPWRAMPMERLKELRVIGQYLGRTIPQLLIMDTHGKLLVDSDQVTRLVALQRLEALLKQPPAHN